MLVASLLVQTACGDSTRSDSAPEIADPPTGLTQDCERPVELPQRTLTQSEVEAYWIADRENLIRCGVRLAALREFYSGRDERLRGD